jgi:cytochrome c biogenesis protein CcdA
MTELIENFGQYVHTNPWLAVVAVFLGGLVTASNPCVLAMIPLMIAFVAGRREEGLGPIRGAGYSFVFVVGLSVTFTALGVVAALAGSLYGDTSAIWSWIVAAVCLVMGLHLLDVLAFKFPVPFDFQPKTRGAVGALILGLLFGVVSAPCAAPILVVLLTYLAASDSSIAYGGLLLFVYGLGHSVLVLLAGTSMGAARRMIESKKMKKATDVLRKAAGALILLMGAYFVYQAVT